MKKGEEKRKEERKNLFSGIFISTTSLFIEPRESASWFPSGEKAKLKIRSIELLGAA